MDQYIKVLVAGSSNSVKSDFINIALKFLPRQKFAFNFELQEIPSGLPLRNFKSKHAALILYKLSSRTSFKQALAISADIDIPKVIIGNQTDKTRKVQLQEALRYSKQTGAAYIEICTILKQNIYESLYLLQQQILVYYRELKKKRCKIRLNASNLYRIKKLSQFFSVICSIWAVFVVITGSVEILNPQQVKTHQILLDSMLLSGTTSFIICSLGFYGSRKSGIKEYLKAFYVLILGISVYKLIVLLGYLYTDFQSRIDNITVPVLIVSLMVDAVASLTVFIHANAIGKLQEAPNSLIHGESDTIFKIK